LGFLLLLKGQRRSPAPPAIINDLTMVLPPLRIEYQKSDLVGSEKRKVYYYI